MHTILKYFRCNHPQKTGIIPRKFCILTVDPGHRQFSCVDSNLVQVWGIYHCLGRKFGPGLYMFTCARTHEIITFYKEGVSLQLGLYAPLIPVSL